MAKRYCPYCKSPKPMQKAGWQMRVGGKPSQQRWKCNNRGCYRITVNPLKNKPRQRGEKS